MQDIRPLMTRAKDLGLGNGAIPSAYYTDPAFLEREREQLFGRAWLLVAREEELPEPGSFITLDVTPRKASVLICRTKEGELRAFHNACSHRGVALVEEKQGKSLTFRCPYHAWTYGIDGGLRAIPCESDFPGLDKSRHGLAPIHLAAWNGFVFLNFAAEPELSLHEFLAGIDTLLDGLPFADYPFHIKVTSEIDANWKFMVNAFNEGYHVGILHNKTLNPQVIPKENPFLHYLDIQAFGPHSTGTVQRNFDWSPSTPVLTWVMSQLLPVSVPDKDALAEGRSGLSSHPALNRVKIPNFGTETITIFPNISIQPLAHGYLFYQFWPISHERMRTEVRIYAKAAPATLRQEFAIANTLAAARDVVSEDLAMCARQQIGLQGGGKPHQIFGELEPILRLFIREYENYLSGRSLRPTAIAAE